MRNTFLRHEQESSRSDAMVFCGKGWSGFMPWGGTRRSCAIDPGIKQEQEQAAQGKRDRGTWEKREAKTGKSTLQPLWVQVRSFPLVLHACEPWDTHSASAASSAWW